MAVIDLAKKREENNKRVLEKLKTGESLSVSTTEDTWFPPRGVFDRKLGRMVPAKPKDDMSETQ